MELKIHNLHLNHKNFIVYKFFNSLFLGTSIGSIFIIYSPLEPAIYSVGGIVLAFGVMAVAYFYENSYEIALCVYIGYQITFIFGSYLGRVETLLLKEKSILKAVDISKQAGYMVGLLLSYIIFLFIGIKATDLNDGNIQINEKQKQYILTKENKLLIGLQIPDVDVDKVYEKKELSSTQLSSLKTIVSKNQVYYLHYVLVLFEILVIIFLMRSFRSRSG